MCKIDYELSPGGHPRCEDDYERICAECRCGDVCDTGQDGERYLCRYCDAETLAWMTQCSHCGTWVPREETINDNGDILCAGCS